MKFAEALEGIPRILAENAGLSSTEIVTQLYAAHKQGNKTAGVNVEVQEFFFFFMSGLGQC